MKVEKDILAKWKEEETLQPQNKPWKELNDKALNVLETEIEDIDVCRSWYFTFFSSPWILFVFCDGFDSDYWWNKYIWEERMNRKVKYSTLQAFCMLDMKYALET